jgi:hypothetical protein
MGFAYQHHNGKEEIYCTKLQEDKHVKTFYEKKTLKFLVVFF